MGGELVCSYNAKCKTFLHFGLVGTRLRRVHLVVRLVDARMHVRLVCGQVDILHEKAKKRASCPSTSGNEVVSGEK